MAESRGKPEKENKGGSRSRGGQGTLYVVSTPIGNLEDITLRALRILGQVDLIAAENVRHSRALCTHYGIRTRLTAYNQHNHRAKGPEILYRLKSGWDVALVTSAGTPVISDPGGALVGKALEEDLRVSPVPGPSALTAALAVAGMRTDRFLFLGFLSNRPGKRKRELRRIAEEPFTLVFFEAPHRLGALLRDILDILGDRHAVLLRELTKLYEEGLRGPLSHVMDRLAPEKIKGECTLLVAGSAEIGTEVSMNEEIQRRIEGLLRKGDMSLRDMAECIASEEDLAYRDVYRVCLSAKRRLRGS
ncbi:MAG: 16S rRNA (cytidine(1402)-2'-O)-methyltransferase [Deltaproteobacteria bacterium]|nr:16S rRNA (cytidine(1402)-2'-O)-methyltransferase [Deltaproteobacteria bacterium]